MLCHCDSQSAAAQRKEHRCCSAAVGTRLMDEMLPRTIMASCVFVSVTHWFAMLRRALRPQCATSQQRNAAESTS